MDFSDIQTRIEMNSDMELLKIFTNTITYPTGVLESFISVPCNVKNNWAYIGTLKRNVEGVGFEEHAMVGADVVLGVALPDKDQRSIIYPLEGIIANEIHHSLFVNAVGKIVRMEGRLLPNPEGGNRKFKFGAYALYFPWQI